MIRMQAVGILVLNLLLCSHASPFHLANDTAASGIKVKRTQKALYPLSVRQIHENDDLLSNEQPWRVGDYVISRSRPEYLMLDLSGSGEDGLRQHLSYHAHWRNRRDGALEAKYYGLAESPEVLNMEGERKASLRLQSALSETEQRHFVPLKFSVYDPNEGLREGPLFLIQHRCKLGALTKLRNHRDEVVTEGALLDMMRQLLQGIEIMHKAGIYHTNLELRNVFWERGRSDHFVTRIGLEGAFDLPKNDPTISAGLISQEVQRFGNIFFDLATGGISFPEAAEASLRALVDKAKTGDSNKPSKLAGFCWKSVNQKDRLQLKALSVELQTFFQAIYANSDITAAEMLAELESVKDVYQSKQ